MRGKLRCAPAGILLTVLVIPVLSALISGGGVGCAQRPDPPPVAYCGPTLASADMGISQVDYDATLYVILEQTRSRGRFPCALAVARLEPQSPLDLANALSGSSGITWQVASIPDEQAVRLNALFNTVPKIREVIVLDRLSVVSPDVNLHEIIASVARLEASLCLVFGPSAAAQDHAAWTGVLVEVPTGRHVACLRAEAGPADFEPPHTDRVKEDERHRDVNYLSACKFEQQVRHCMLELIGRDQPFTTTQPSPWRTATTQPALSPIYIIPNRHAGW